MKFEPVNGLAAGGTLSPSHVMRSYARQIFPIPLPFLVPAVQVTTSTHPYQLIIFVSYRLLTAGLVFFNFLDSLDIPRTVSWKCGSVLNK